VPTLPDAPRRATRSSAVCGDGNHGNSKVTRQPLSRHAFNTLTYPRPEQVVSKAKLCLSRMSVRILAIMSHRRPP
jgi:hypothetical protein